MLAEYIHWKNWHKNTAYFFVYGIIAVYKTNHRNIKRFNTHTQKKLRKYNIISKLTVKLNLAIENYQTGSTKNTSRAKAIIVFKKNLPKISLGSSTGGFASFLFQYFWIAKQNSVCEGYKQFQ